MKKGNIFVRPEGGLRAIWLLLGAVIAVRGAAFCLRTGMNVAFSALFGAWNINAGNIGLAPGWAQAVYAWHASFTTVCVSLASVFVCCVIRRHWPGIERRSRGGSSAGLIPAALGAGIAIVSAAVFLLTDSMRAEWPLSEPRLSFSVLVMLPVTLLTAFSEELFTRGVVLDGLLTRLKRPWAVMTSALVFFLFNGGYSGNPVSAVNVFLMGVVCCLLYMDRGIWAAALFRGMWSYSSVFVAGFGTTSAARSVYALYSVSENALTGGDGGMIYGLWMTAILLGMLAFMRPGPAKGAVSRLKRLTNRIIRQTDAKTR